MLLAHAVKFHKAWDWIRPQDQSTLTYTSLLNHCKHLEQWCKQFQKAQLKGRAQLITLTAATSTHSSIHQDAITVNSTCRRCGNSHLRGNCPNTGQRCNNCNRIGHFSDLCRSRNTRYTNNYRQSRHHQRKSNKHSGESRSLSSSSSTSPKRDRSHSRHTRRHRSPTLHTHHVSTITLNADHTCNSSDTSDTDEDQPYQRRCPTPHPYLYETYTTESDSDTELENISITLHLQDEDHLSTGYNASTPPKTDHILLSPPRTHNKMLPGPATPNTQPSAQRTEPANTQPQPTHKSPLLPTPPAPARQHIKSTFPKPSPFNNNRFHQQPYIPGLHTARFNNQCPPLLPSPSYHHQRFITRPYPHPQVHFTLQVSTYLPVLLPYPSHLITSLQYMYAA